MSEIRPPGGRFSPSVVIQGKVHGYVGPLRATAGVVPRFAQIWVYDPNHEKESNIRLQNMRLPAGTTPRVRSVLSCLLSRLQELLHSNPYIQDFITAVEIPEDALVHCRLIINANARPYGGHVRIYLCEVSVLYNEQPGKRDIIVQLREGGIKEIADTHRSSDALYFVLIHPLGHDGWHVQPKQVNPNILDKNGNPMPTDNRLTTREFYAFHLHQRSTSGNCLLRMCRLFQEYLCVQCAKYENQKLFWLRSNQNKIRADLYNNIIDAVHQNDVNMAQNRH